MLRSLPGGYIRKLNVNGSVDVVYGQETDRFRCVVIEDLARNPYLPQLMIGLIYPKTQCDGVTRVR